MQCPGKLLFFEFPDAKGIVESMRAFDQSTGIIVSMNEFRKDVIDRMDVLFIPIWFFLLVL